MKFLHFFHRQPSSRLAKDRLKIMLISDRINCSPEMMSMIKTDIARVLSKYMKIDTKSMEIQITKEAARGRVVKSPILYVNIPILDLNHQA